MKCSQSLPASKNQILVQMSEFKIYKYSQAISKLLLLELIEQLIPKDVVLLAPASRMSDSIQGV